MAEQARPPWDLNIAGRPVDSLYDLIAWLGAGERSEPEQQAAVRGFLSVNRRAIPAELEQAAEAFAG